MHQEAGIPDFVVSPPIECVVFGWGCNEDGQLGFGDGEESVTSPRVVEALLGTRLRGREPGRSPLVTGSRMSLAIGANGEMWSWGWNERGTLGHGDKCKRRMPRMLTALRNVKVVQAAVGGWHALVVTEAGKVYAWGGNEYGQCGVDADKRDIIAPMPCLTGLRVKQVACGGMHSLALTDEGDVYSWGERWGEFSLKIDSSPRLVDGAHNIKQIACGAFHNLALTTEGPLLAWGTNDFGQLGNGSTTYRTSPHLVVNLEGIHVIDIAAGGWHSMALTQEGEVFVWGRGEYGRLGLGDPACSSRLRPHKVPGLEAYRIIQISAGGTHSAVLSDTGQVLIWGRGSFGRIGISSAKNQLLACEANLPGGQNKWRVIALSCGGRHTTCLALPVQPGSTVETGSTGSDGDIEVSDAVSGRSYSFEDTPGAGKGVCNSSVRWFGAETTVDEENRPVNSDPQNEFRDSSVLSCNSRAPDIATNSGQDVASVTVEPHSSEDHDSPRTCVSLKEGIVEGAEGSELDNETVKTREPLGKGSLQL